MAEHIIELVWDKKNDIVTVVQNIDSLQIGDTILFKSKDNVGQVVVTFLNGSPFSDNPNETITDSNPRPVKNLPRFRFACGVIPNGEQKVHANGKGGDTPRPGGN